MTTGLRAPPRSVPPRWWRPRSRSGPSRRAGSSSGLAESLAGRCNTNAASDLEVASLLAVAASHAAAANVTVNLPSIGDETRAAELQQATNAMVDEVDRLATTARAHVHGGETRAPLAGPA